jgi:ATP-dependent protease ClpP protease subunit
MKAEIRLHGTFGKVSDEMPHFVGSSIASQIDALNLQGVDEIQLRINSNGGYVNDLIDIVNAVARSKAKVSTFVEGFAKSCGFILALCGKERYATSYSVFNTHNPFVPVPTATESEIMALDASRESLLQIAKSAGINIENLSGLMASNTTMSASKAKENGFVDRIVSIDFQADGDEKMQFMAFSKFAVMNYVSFEKPKHTIMDENKELNALLAVIGANDFKGAVSAITDLKNNVQNYSQEVATLKKEVEEVKKSRVVGMVDKAIEEKRIDPSQRETVMNFCVSAGEEKAAGFLAGLKPTIVNMVPEPAPNPADDKKHDDFNFEKYLISKQAK